jgi:signal peptidase I
MSADGAETAASPAAAPVVRSERRVAGPLVALLWGPLGHIAIGHWRRACAWYAAEVATAFACGLGATVGSGKVLWGAVIVFAILRLSIVADVWRLDRLHPLPRPRLVVVIGLGIGIFYEILGFRVRSSFVEAFNVPSGSMSPTIEPGDHIFVRKRGGPFQRGEIAVFRYPLDPSVDYVKRIVGVGGDVLAGKAGQLIVNGQPIARRRLDEPCGGDERPAPGGSPRKCALWEESLDGRSWRVALDDEMRASDFAPVVVPPGSYFVVGDNRDASSDSRVWGPVAADLVKGSASFIYWSSSDRGVRWERINQPVR